LVAKTAINASTTGIQIEANGTITATRAGRPFILNRTNTDGDLIELRKDNAKIGSIGSKSGNTFIDLKPGAGGAGFRGGDAKILPYVNNADSDATVDIGNTGARFKNLYLSGTANAGGVTVDGNTTNLNYGKTFFTNGLGANKWQIWNDNGGADKFQLVDGDGHLVFQAEQSGDISFYEDTGTTPKFQWSAGNERLVLKTSGAYALDVQASGNSSATIARFSNSNASDKLAIRLDANGDGELVLIDAGNNEDVVITAGGDSYFNGGDLLVGKTSSDIGTNGFEATSSGIARITRTSATANVNPALVINRKSSDGPLVDLKKDGTTVGFIGVHSGSVTIGDTDTGLYFNDAYNRILPFTLSSNAGRDNAIDLGASTDRFKNLYLSGNAYIGNAVTAGTDGSTSLVLEGVAHIFRKGSAGSFAEYGRFDASGNLLVGTTSGVTGSVAGGFQVQNNSGTGTTINIGHPDGAASGFSYALFSYNNSIIGSIGQSGTTAVLYNTSSDQRLKENIVDAPSASDDIDAIQVRSFDWKADGSHQKYGMVAQELQSVAPEAVSGDSDSDDMMGVDYSKLVPMMLKEIQSLRARVAQLEGEN
jgi:hypothetical protein